MDLIGEEEEEKDHGSSYMSDESSHQNFTLGAGGKPCNNNFSNSVDKMLSIVPDDIES